MAADGAVDVLVGPDGHLGDVDGAAAVPAGQALFVVDPALDVDLLGLEDGALAARAAALVAQRLEHRRVRVDERHLCLWEALLEAVLAVDLAVGRVVRVVQRGVQHAVALVAVEALLVPVVQLRALALRLEDLQEDGKEGKTDGLLLHAGKEIYSIYLHAGTFGSSSSLVVGKFYFLAGLIFIFSFFSCRRLLLFCPIAYNFQLPSPDRCIFSTQLFVDFLIHTHTV